MILSHRAPSNLNTSSYKAIWTHFRSNSVIFIILIFKNYLSELQISGQMAAQPSGRPKVVRRCSKVVGRWEGSRWVPGFAMGSWIHDVFLDSR